MTDATDQTGAAPARHTSGSLLAVSDRTRRRNAAETRFKAYGIAAITIAILALATLLYSIIRDGAGAFQQTYASIPVAISPEVVDPKGNRDPAEMTKVISMSYGKLLDDALKVWIADEGIAVEGLDDADIKSFFSNEAQARLRDMVLADPALIGQTVGIFAVFEPLTADDLGRPILEIGAADGEL